MKKLFTLFAVFLLTVPSFCQASELDSALKAFSAYEFGQPKKQLHATRMTAFRGTGDENRRLENEKLLLAFIESEATVLARREACLWLCDLGSQLSQPLLSRLCEDSAFSDVAQIALDEVSKKQVVKEALPSTALAKFKLEVLASSKPEKLLIKAMKGDDDQLARASFAWVAEGLAQDEVVGWLKENLKVLDESRQIVALNLLVPILGEDLEEEVIKLSEEGQGELQRVAIRHLGVVGGKRVASNLVQLFCADDPKLVKAAEVALRSMSETEVGDAIRNALISDNAAQQAKGLQLLEMFRSDLASDIVWGITEQDENPNQKAAIRTLGRTVALAEYKRVLDKFVGLGENPRPKDWQLALWDLSRRQADYVEALELLKSQQALASAETARILETLGEKLESIRTGYTPDEITAPPYTKTKAPAKAFSNVLLPGSYSHIIPKRFEVAAYINCGPEKESAQQIPSIQCLNGQPFNNEGGKNPAESILFASANLEFHIDGLAAHQEYVLGMTWWDINFNERWQSIWINDQEVLPDTRAMVFDERNPELPRTGWGRPTPARIQFVLLPEHIKNGACKVVIKGNHGPNVVTSEMWVAKRVKPKAEKQVLLVSGQDFPGHHWRETATVMETLISEDDRMEVTLCETPYALGLKHLKAYDVIFIHFKNYANALPSTELMQQNLKRFVLRGGGMCLSHFACGAFMEWPDFVNLSGRIWSRGGHDPRGPFTVKVVDQNHPVTEGLGTEFQTDDELYWCLTGDPDIHLLCEAMSTAKKAMQPQALVFEPGKGRTFLSTLGHDVKAYDAAKVRQLYRQGTAWAAGLE